MNDDQPSFIGFVGIMPARTEFLPGKRDVFPIPGIIKSNPAFLVSGYHGKMAKIIFGWCEIDNDRQIMGERLSDISKSAPVFNASIKTLEARHPQHVIFSCAVIRGCLEQPGDMFLTVLFAEKCKNHLQAGSATEMIINLAIKGNVHGMTPVRSSFRGFGLYFNSYFETTIGKALHIERHLHFILTILLVEICHRFFVYRVAMLA